MNPTLESIAGGHSSPDAELDICIDQIEPVILGLMQRGIRASTIIAALARLTVVTVGRERYH